MTRKLVKQSRASKRALTFGVPLPVAALPVASQQGFDLLQGIRVLDLTTSIAGPFGSMLLADVGCDVVKVERPGAGDDSRAWGPPFVDGQGLWFLAVNRNKRSVAIDYSNPNGAALLHQLVAKADVLMTSFRGETLKRLGLDHGSLLRAHPTLICCSISGFGMTGPRAELPGYDLVAEGYSGVMDLTGEPDGLPQKVGTSAADLLAGMDAAFAVVAALFERASSGAGHSIDVSLGESMTRFLTPRIVSYLGSGELPRRSGGRDSVVAVYQVFETADEPITLALGNDAIFARFCAAIDMAELAANPAYATNELRRLRRDELVSTIQLVLREKKRAEWLAALASADVPAGPINRLDEVIRDPQFLYRNLFYRIPQGSGVPQVNTGWHLDGHANGFRLAPPAVGVHTEEVLRSWCGSTGPKTPETR